MHWVLCLYEKKLRSSDLYITSVNGSLDQKKLSKIGKTVILPIDRIQKVTSILPVTSDQSADRSTVEVSVIPLRDL